MTEYYPNYYSKFKCIAGSCRHSCCKGWEIDVDDDSLERYEEYPDIKCHIKDGSFVLDEQERCPFLQEDGLCRMILKYGEQMLCDICSDHPRFRNYGEDYVDMGLGLCCEAAAALILDYDEPFALKPDRELDEVFAMLADPGMTISEKIRILSPVTLGSSERAELFESLERLDPSWDKMLSDVKDLKGAGSSIDELTGKRLCNFATYILYRHGSGQRRLAAECTLLILDLVNAGYDIFEAARMFSSEVEYSDINVDCLLNSLE